MHRFDVKYRSIFPWPATPVQSGVAAVGNRLYVSTYVNPDNVTDKLSKINIQAHTAVNMYRCETII